MTPLAHARVFHLSCQHLNLHHTARGKKRVMCNEGLAAAAFYSSLITHHSDMVTRNALLYLSRREGLKDFATRFRFFKKMTTRFVAGEDIEEAIAAIRELNAKGCTASFDHLNESVANASETEEEV